MVNIVVLQDTLNPISAQERVKINQNWDALRRGFSSLQNQINFLSGGTEVDIIVARIEQAIQDAQTNTQNAIDNVNNNYAEKLVEINQSLEDLATTITNSQTATNEANIATDNATNATSAALEAINQIQLTINNFSPRGDFVLGTQYRKGNIVSNGNGSSYIAIQDNINSPLTNVNNWMLLASVGRQGIQGEKGETGSGFEVKGYFPNLQDLESAISSPQAGDAYGVGAVEPYDIYIYDGVNNIWVNNGALQGAKGDRGERGPEGPPGETPDLTPIQTQLFDHESRITFLENEDTVVKSNVSGLNREVAYLKLRQEASERIEGGTVFADDFLGSRFGISLNETKTNLKVDIPVGTTVLTDKIGAINGGNFAVGDKVNIVDVNKSEIVTITRSEASGVLECSPTVNSYSRYSIIGNSTIESNGNFGNTFTTVDLDLDTLISNEGGYSTIGAHNSKIAMMPNGYIIVASYIANGIRLYISYDDGRSWSILYSQTYNSLVTDISLVITSEESVGYLVCYDNTNVEFRRINVNTGVSARTSIVDNGQRTVERIAMVKDFENNKLHAVWAGTNNTYSVTNNLRYSSSNDNGNTWTAPIQVTSINTANVGANSPSIQVYNNAPYILFNVANNRIRVSTPTGLDTGTDTIWTYKDIVSTPTRLQNLSTFHISANGTLYAAWTSYETTSSSSTLTVSYAISTNLGATWNVQLDLTNGQRPAISENSKGEIFFSVTGGGMCRIYKKRSIGTEFDLIGTPIAAITVNTISNRDVDFEIPLMVVARTGSNSFVGKFKGYDPAQVNNGILTYNIEPTEYVAFFLKFNGPLSATAYVNDSLMDLELNGDEYQFEYSLDTKTPVKVRIEASRQAIGSQKIDRILGGRS